MKEDEAIYKWCPMASGRVVVAPLGKGEKEVARLNTNGKVSTYCIASDCMMWRSHGKTESVSPKDLGGYCGLGGKP